MIRIDDTAIILTVRKHAETSALVELLTARHGVYKGIARGAFSKINRGTWQPGNLVAMRWSARLSDQLGSLTAELVTPYAAHILPDARALSMLSSATALLATALPERHAYPKLYAALTHLLEHLAHSPHDALSEYLHFELLLLAETGFGLDLTHCAATGATDDLIYVSPKSGRAVSRDAGAPYHDKMLALPRFLRDEHDQSASDDELKSGLTLTAYFLEHWLFDALHRKMPAARLRLIII